MILPTLTARQEAIAAALILPVLVPPLWALGHWLRFDEPIWVAIAGLIR